MFLVKRRVKNLRPSDDDSVADRHGPPGSDEPSPDRAAVIWAARGEVET
jgi:hypothetical protein